jgi:NAD(P)-dependent dehydrogenase (short-subunit alcohol dehydrogenase family)
MKGAIWFVAERRQVYPDLQDKRVIVTAGGSGIGRAIAEALDDAGARVCVCDAEPDALEAIADARPGIVGIVADVSDPEQVDHLFDEALDRMGGLDILVNNAGIAGPTGPVEHCAVAEWRRTLAIDLDGQFFCLRRAVPVMKQARAGAIVNISSTAGLYGYPLRSPYAAAKWAVIGLTKSVAAEVGPYGITVNAICPGSVEGPRMARVIAAEAKSKGTTEQAIRDSYTRHASLRCFVTAEDIANGVLFLCSRAGARISGHVLTIDGNTETLSG